ncbi:hypothetical protein QNE28_001065 [Vibrio fluvialis]|nr:hypothetical protein [Vibrio fluvialis]
MPHFLEIFTSTIDAQQSGQWIFLFCRPAAIPDAHLFINSGYTGRTWPNNLLHICLAICPLAATHT